MIVNTDAMVPRKYLVRDGLDELLGTFDNKEDAEAFRDLLNKKTPMKGRVAERVFHIFVTDDYK